MVSTSDPDVDTIASAFLEHITIVPLMTYICDMSDPWYDDQ